MLELTKKFPIQTPKHWKAYFQKTNPIQRYTCLADGPHLVMSDTPYERKIYEQMLPKIQGKTLILGMGIGLLNSMLEPNQCSEIVVIDNNPRAFELAAQYLKDKPHDPYEKIEADANNQWQMKQVLRGRRFDTIVWDLFGPKYRPIYSQFVAYGGEIVRWEAN